MPLVSRARHVHHAPHFLPAIVIANRHRQQLCPIQVPGLGPLRPPVDLDAGRIHHQIPDALGEKIPEATRFYKSPMVSNAKLSRRASPAQSHTFANTTLCKSPHFARAQRGRLQQWLDRRPTVLSRSLVCPDHSSLHRALYLKQAHPETWPAMNFW